jgi:hypothetical protein
VCQCHITDVYVGDHMWQCVLLSSVFKCVVMSYHGCVHRQPHAATCVLISIQMCIDVISLLHCMKQTCVLFFQNQNVWRCCILLHYIEYHRCCFSSVQLCVDVISCCITLKQSCVLFFQCPKVW